MRIGVDIDGVLGDMMNPFLEFHNSRYSTNVKLEDVHTMQLEKIFDKTAEEIIEDFNRFNETTFGDIPPLDKADLVVKELVKDHKLFVVSSRPKRILDLSIKWLNNKFGDVFASVHHVGHTEYSKEEKTKCKHDVCAEENMDIFIEDEPRYCEALASTGAKVFLIDHPWNKDYNTPENVIRVRDWDEILARIKELENAKKD